jgi:hypothetical protein
VPSYEFQLVLADVSAMSEDISNALFEAGCDDGTPFSSQGVASVGFTRDAANLEEAVRSAIADVNKAGFTVARVEPGEESVYAKINHELARN